MKRIILKTFVSFLILIMVTSVVSSGNYASAKFKKTTYKAKMSKMEARKFLISKGLSYFRWEDDIDKSILIMTNGDGDFNEYNSTDIVSIDHLYDNVAEANLEADLGNYFTGIDFLKHHEYDTKSEKKFLTREKQRTEIAMKAYFQVMYGENSKTSKKVYKAWMKFISGDVPDKHNYYIKSLAGHKLLIDISGADFGLIRIDRVYN